MDEGLAHIAGRRVNHDIRDVTRKGHAIKLAEAVPTLFLEPPLHSISARSPSRSPNRSTQQLGVYTCFASKGRIETQPTLILPSGLRSTRNHIES